MPNSQYFQDGCRHVGINTAIVSRSGGNNGIAFSVPSDLALQVADQLIKYGEVRRGSIGISMAKVSEAASEKVGIDHWDSALVAKLLPGSPAALAGLRTGTFIRPIDSEDNVPSHVKGVYVNKITPDSPAECSGLVVGDVIGGINNDETDSMEDSDLLVSKSKGRARLVVYRYGVAIPIIIEP